MVILEVRGSRLEVREVTALPKGGAIFCAKENTHFEILIRSGDRSQESEGDKSKSRVFSFSGGAAGGMFNSPEKSYQLSAVGRALPVNILSPDSWLLDSAVCKTAPPTRRFFIAKESICHFKALKR